MTIETIRIPHDGGENPVREGETLVKVWFRGDDVPYDAAFCAADYIWIHDGDCSDIIAYAVTPERAPSPPAKAPTMNAVEAVARALFDTMHPTGTTWRQWEQQVEKHGGFDGRNRSRELAQAALSAARPFIAAECAKVAEKRGFTHGYLIAVTTMLHQHDCPVTAEDALSEIGITWRQVRKLGLDDFDLDLLRPIFQNMARKKKWAKRAPTAIKETIR